MYIWGYFGGVLGLVSTFLLNTRCAKVCKRMAFMDVIMGLGLLCFHTLGFRYPKP